MAAFEDRVKNLYHRTTNGAGGRTLPAALHDKQARICVVGGGAGGVHLACLLKQAGYQNIRLFESGPQLGGKCYGRMSEDVCYELGFMLNVVSEARNPLQQLLQEYGLEEFAVSVVEGNWSGGEKMKASLKMNRYDSDVDDDSEDAAVMGDDADAAGGALDTSDGGPKIEAPTKIPSSATRRPVQHDEFKRSVSDLGTRLQSAALSDLPPFRRLLTRRISDIKMQVAAFFGNEPLVAAARRYTKLHKKLLGTYPHGMPPRPRADAMEQLKCSFAELLKKHDLLSLIPVFILCPIVFSYHFLLELPAFYGLWWYNPTRVTALIDFHNGALKLPQYIALKCGYQTLWNKMAEDNQITVELNTSVKSITRWTSPRSPGKLVTVRSGSEEHVTHEFDVLVLACNLKTGIALLEDASEEERQLAAAMREFTLCSTVFDAEPRPGERPLELFPFPKRHNAFGQVFAQINPRLMLTRDVPKDAQAKERRIVYQFLSRSPRVEDMSMLKRRLKMYFDDQGMHKAVVLKQAPWKFFQFYNATEGWPWRLQETQGQAATLYVGASACFDSINEILMHNEALVQTLKMV